MKGEGEVSPLSVKITSYNIPGPGYYRRICFEAIDLIVNAIDLRFNQPGYVMYVANATIVVVTLAFLTAFYYKNVAHEANCVIALHKNKPSKITACQLDRDWALNFKIILNLHFQIPPNLQPYISI